MEARDTFVRTEAHNALGVTDAGKDERLNKRKESI